VISLTALSSMSFTEYETNIKLMFIYLLSHIVCDFVFTRNVFMDMNGHTGCINFVIRAASINNILPAKVGLLHTEFNALVCTMLTILTAPLLLILNYVITVETIFKY